MAEEVGSRPTPMVGTAPSVPTDDWPVQAADGIVALVGKVHDKVTGPVQTVVRAITYGLLAVVLGTALAVLFVILGLRLVNIVLPDALFGKDHMWAAHGLLGVLFTSAGLWCWNRRTRPVEE
ncbi:MAG: hypothetical protein ACT4PW_04200 [Acidimicrobiia bacterium]